MTLTERLVQELMLVSVVVAGEGAAALAASLEADGAAAEALAASPPSQSFDLAILLAAPGDSGRPETRRLVDMLNTASERLLFAPLPLGPAAPGPPPAFPELAQWFEVFAEFGYQPVIEFDASFVSPGAFLVDRAAIAAESDLAAFADRLQLGPEAAAAQRPTGEEPAGKPAGPDTEALKADLAALRADLDKSRAEAARVAAERSSEKAEAARVLREIETRNAGWESLRLWVRASVAEPSRDTPAALARDLPRLNALRSPALPFQLPALRRRRFWRAAPPSPPILADTALVRASRLFDAAWYVASTPDLTDGPPLDPVFHYVLVGWRRGADPGPWFDTAAYLAAHPEIDGAGICPLIHAIRIGADVSMSVG